METCNNLWERLCQKTQPLEKVVPKTLLKKVYQKTHNLWEKVVPNAKIIIFY